MSMVERALGGAAIEVAAKATRPPGGLYKYIPRCATAVTPPKLANDASMTRRR
jgi:hypothetical protein